MVPTSADYSHPNAPRPKVRFPPGIILPRPQRMFSVCVAFCVLMAVLLPSCNMPGYTSSGGGASGVPHAQIASISLQEPPRPTLILAGPDSTATPTPFQPLPPTPLPGMAAVFTPTQPSALSSGVVPPAVEASVQPQISLTAVAALVATATATATATQSSAQSPGVVPPAVETPLIGFPTLTPLPTDYVPSATPIPPEIAQLPDQINILLLGADKRPWDSQFRTDTIMLVVINSKQGSVNILSFPRDLYVTIPGYGQNRINTAWTFGGYPLLRQTFKQNFGVEVDYYALIEFDAFKHVVDGLGGLTVNVGEDVSDYRAGYWYTIKKGAQVMDADTVLWYVRTRKTTNDIARNRRQQEVLQALADKLISLNALSRAPDFYEVYKNAVTTNIGLLDVLKWLPVAVQVAQNGNIHHFFLTYNHFYDSITPEGAMVLVPQMDAVMNMIRKTENLR